ncbi:hypothetical protein Ndes2526B_g04083 [Nannochloris sp. 'desiccata']|nr:hypothetical protein KSW81_001128 [Chlorella desiccata (nom. nud.)]KAH7620173.1 hypothetical protein NADE_002803 [Chlorella desiccata (nom. nud.)]
MAEALQVYRTLLRAINRNVTHVTGNRQWYIFAKDEFRRHRTASEDKERAELLRLAKDYAFMINGVKDHTELLLSYNVGIHIDDREKHMMKRAAALVGLALPPDRKPYVK